MDSIFVKPLDLMILEGRQTKASAQMAYFRIRKILKKEPGKMITVREYANARGCTVEEIEKKIFSIYNQ